MDQDTIQKIATEVATPPALSVVGQLTCPNAANAVGWRIGRFPQRVPEN